MGPLLAWSLRFIRDFAGDILRAAAEAAPLHAAGQRSRGLHLRKSALPGLLAQYEAEGRPLPGYRGKVNMTFLGRKLACPQRCIVRARSLINATAAIVGIDSGTYLDARPAALLDGERWLARFDYSRRGHDSVGTLTRMLQSASYVVTSYLSGMRDAEIKHLRRGCLTVSRDSSGAAYRWKVTSLAFKGENDPSGITATWSVGRPVAEAIAVLERLQPEGQDLLFARLAFREGVRPGSANVAMSSAATSTAVSDFASWVNDYCDLRHRRDRIPGHGDTPVEVHDPPVPSHAGLAHRAPSRRGHRGGAAVPASGHSALRGLRRDQRQRIPCRSRKRTGDCPRRAPARPHRPARPRPADRSGRR